MTRVTHHLWVVVLLAAGAADLDGQSTRDIEDVYQLRVRMADSDSATSRDRVLAAEASRFMRKFDESAFYLERAEVSADGPADENAALRERLNFQLAVGSPISELQATFAESRARRDMPLVVVAGWTNAFPELLIGGGYDELIAGLSADATDPEHRCACYAQKAWMHRVAGRMETSRLYWDSLNLSWAADMPEFANAFDEADWRAQRARNLARAGRHDEARRELATATAVNVSAFESVSILRRRAQAYAELGDVESAVADLEALLEVPSPVTAHTIRNRVTWEPIRGHPAFQELLRKHPIP